MITEVDDKGNLLTLENSGISDESTIIFEEGDLPKKGRLLFKIYLWRQNPILKPEESTSKNPRIHENHVTTTTTTAVGTHEENIEIVASSSSSSTTTSDNNIVNETAVVVDEEANFLLLEASKKKHLYPCGEIIRNDDDKLIDLQQAIFQMISTLPLDVFDNG